MARRTLLVTYIATYLLAIASLIRYLVRFHHDGLWPIVLLAGGYLLLLLLEPIFARRYRPLTYIYLLAQSGLICAIAVTAPTVDYWAILFCPLVVQVRRSFPRRTGFLIAGLFTAITSAFQVQQSDHVSDGYDTDDWVLDRGCFVASCALSKTEGS